MLQMRQQLDRLAAERRKLPLGRFRGRDDMPGEHRQGARGQRGRDRAPLVPPGLALGHQQALAEHRLQHALAADGAAIVFVVVDEDVADRVGIVQQHLVAAEKAPRQHALLVGGLAPDLERVAAQHEVGFELGAHAVDDRWTRQRGGVDEHA